ncbi:transposase [Streptomyces sp. NPDC102279]|uniref:transposase n=1 Tax=Streptomyces sp. NPDC102279 TaxID=3366153 RepID=UPI0037F798EF
MDEEAFTVEELIALAHEAAGGGQHHLVAVQLPVSLVMVVPITQARHGRGPLLAAVHAGLPVMASAPLDASSGKNNRHRLNTGGNRALNCVLHIIAVCQIRDGGRGQDYYLRKIAEGKTPAEARRALKRRLSNVVYRTPKRDRHRTLPAAA